MTTFDRYLLQRFLYVCMVFTIAVLGLYIIIDGFTNLDAFQLKSEGKGTTYLVLLMAERYVYQSANILDLAGPTIVVISALCALALMLKQGEIHPMLAAGVPTYRWALALPVGALLLNAAMVFNQEWVLPRIAPHLQTNHGDTVNDKQAVQPQYDPKWWIFITGESTIPGEQRIDAPEFLLPPSIAGDFVKLRGESAYFYARDGESPPGWLITKADPPVTSLKLTDQGRQALVPQPDGTSIFISATLTFDQICQQNSSLRLVSTPELVRRLQQPAASSISRRGQLVQLHARLTRPLLNMLAIFAVIPLIVRRERTSPLQQVTNIGVCMLTLGVMYGGSMACHALGQTGLMRPEQAVWGPLVVSGSYVAWLSGVVRT
ncbi:MAG: LptF/LptG family permease [Planctomycetaceae bacterium]|nr:LptF/LptG family permease [Planctomycetaceae bacterium]MCA9042688.1 LptF/LptG family permease [Planctomycetaceae bacterium]MCB9950688.1 LptF/LptG family permease [Planctomycetaceae bacterium]